MKNKFKPHSQLFLFSNTLDPRIEIWFSGNVIIEQIIPDEENVNGELKKILALIFNLDLGKFKYVTNVINFKTDNLVFLKLSGSYPLICQFSSKKSYRDLNKLYHLFAFWYARLEMLGIFSDLEKRMLQRLKGTSQSRKNAYQIETEILKKLHSNNKKIRDLLVQEFFDKLTL